LIELSTSEHQPQPRDRAAQAMSQRGFDVADSVARMALDLDWIGLRQASHEQPHDCRCDCESQASRSVKGTNERDGNKRHRVSGSTLSLLVAEGLFGSDSSLSFLIELLLQGLDFISSSLSFLVEFSFQGLDSLISFLA